MIITNTIYEYIGCINSIHQIQWIGYNNLNKIINIKDFNEKEIKKLFCQNNHCRIIKNANLLLEDNNLYIIKENVSDNNYVNIIFEDYYIVNNLQKYESKISLKTPNLVIDTEHYFNNKYKFLKFYSVPYNNKFWIKEQKNNTIYSYYWNKKELISKRNFDIEKASISTNNITNIICTIPKSKYIFLVDNDIYSIDLFIKEYTQLYFKYLHDDFYENILKKYDENTYEYIPIINTDIESIIENKIPLYILIHPNDSANDVFSVYKCIQEL